MEFDNINQIILFYLKGFCLIRPNEGLYCLNLGLRWLYFYRKDSSQNIIPAQIAHHH
jgi:hypothetical protein